MRLLLPLVLLLLLPACAASRIPPGPGPTEPALAEQTIVMDDGMALPLRRWQPHASGPVEPKAVILALHGFNDYSNAFEDSGAFWAERGIATYAYDQRGFGAGPHAGLWAGTERLTSDLRAAAWLLAARHPGVPLYLLGVSMGGAVLAVALTPVGVEDWKQGWPEELRGAILSGPAVWARETMPFYQRATLWVAARVIPWARFTGRDLGIQASDNIEMLRALGRDPLFIKRTRVDAIDGLTDLMSAALKAAPRLTAPALLLYGERDEVVPRGPSFAFWRGLPALPPEADGRGQRRALYPEGWHMMLRDLGADVVRGDIAAWIADPASPLPSGADARAEAALRQEPPWEETEIREAEAPPPATDALAQPTAQSGS